MSRAKLRVARTFFDTEVRLTREVGEIFETSSKRAKFLFLEPIKSKRLRIVDILEMFPNKKEINPPFNECTRDKTEIDFP